MKKFFRELSLAMYDIWRVEPELLIPIVIGFVLFLVVIFLIVWGFVALFMWSVGWFFAVILGIFCLVAVPTILILSGKYYKSMEA